LQVAQSPVSSHEAEGKRLFLPKKEPQGALHCVFGGAAAKEDAWMYGRGEMWELLHSLLPSAV